MSVVRPFPARVVRADWAQRLVTSMSDPRDETGADPLGIAVDPAAYDDSAAALYVYRQRDEEGSHVGLVCDVAIEAFVDGRVRGHEGVQPQRVEALIRHHATTTGVPALVALLHHAGPAYTRTIEAALGTAPMLDFVGPGGFRQTVWRVPDGPDAAAVTAELAAAHHYIADGHHRVAAAIEEWRLGRTPADAGLLCVVHPMDELRLSAFHRRVTGPVDATRLIALLTPGFELRSAAQPPTPTPGSFGLYVGHSWSELTYLGDREQGPAGLDVAVLEARLVGPADPAGPGPVEIAPVRESVDVLTRRCDTDGGALLTLAPPPLEVLTSLADAGQVMPPKTTYFAPKPCAGIFLHPGQ